MPMRAKPALTAAILLVLAAHPAAADNAPQRLAQLDRLALPARVPPPPHVDGVPFLIRFAGTVRGLAPGAPVEVRGIRIGDVVSVGVDYVAATNSFVVPVQIELQPSLFPAAGPHPNGANETYAAVDLLVQRGLRAQVAQTLFITGDTIVTLDIAPNVPPANLGRAGPIPEIPAGPTRADMIAEKLQPLLDKLAAAPIDQVFSDIEASMAALKDLATGPELRGTLEELRSAAADLRGVVDRLGVKSDAVMANLDTTMKSTNKLIDRTSETLATVNHQVGDRSPLLADVRGLVEELSGAARSMRLLAEYLERNPSALVTGKTEARP
jgi:paraquat-inducible protein B